MDASTPEFGISRDNVPRMSEDDEFEESSKSARKRDAQRKKALGVRIADLNDEQRATLRLPDTLAQAIVDYRRITSHEAKRRQAQFIGSLMRSIDVEPIERALDDLYRASAQARYAHHETERWRELLIADDAALTDYVRAFPNTDRAQLRTHVRAARKRGDDPTAYRALFRFLRDDAARHAGDASVPPTVT
jgi:ribosome-associated protein